MLFTGDAIDSRRGRLNHSPILLSADEHLANQSAIHLIELAPAVFACGHGAPLGDHDAGTLRDFLNTLPEDD